MSEYHWPGQGFSPVLKSETIHCERCGHDLRTTSCQDCIICEPEQNRSRIFQLRLPLCTLGILKQKHGNISAYLRLLIARDMGREIFPPDFQKALPAKNHSTPRKTTPK